MAGLTDERTLHGPALRHAAAWPDTVALRTAPRDGEPVAVTYGELAERSAGWARVLVEAGVRRGDVVAVCLARGIEQVTAVLAVLRAGAAYVSTEPDHPADRLRGILTDARVPVVLATDAGAATMRAADVVPAGCRVVTPADLDRGPADPAATELPDVGPDDPAFVVFTSGSTGRPKGSMTRHGAVAHKLAWLSRRFPLDTSDRVLQKMSINFDVAVSEIFWSLGCGAQLVLAEPGGHRDSGYLAWAAATHDITVLHFVPSALDVFLLEPQAQRLPKLRLAIAAGEALQPTLVERFRERYDARLLNMYGPSECSIFVSVWTSPDTPPYRPVTVGPVLDGVVAVIVDPDGRPVADGEPGELFLGGVGTGEGYLDRPELTGRAFVTDPTGEHPGTFYRTGDLIRRHPNGHLDFVGRVDDQIKIRGFRVELGEVNAALLEELGYAQAATLPIVNAAGITELHAFVTPTPGVEPRTGAAAAAALAERLPDYMVPARWTLVERLPLNPNLKVDKSALLAIADAEKAARAASPPAAAAPAAATGVAPAAATGVDGTSARTVRANGTSTPVTGSAPVGGAALPAGAGPVAELWARTTGLPADDPDANLFELGGNSLTAARLLAHARAELGLDLRLVEFAMDPTLATLVRALGGDAAEKVENDLLDVRRADRSTAPLHPTQRRLWLLEKLLPGSPAYSIVTMHELRGVLDTDALAAAVLDVGRRHEPLRTTFHDTPDGPRQAFHAEPLTRLGVTRVGSPDAADEWAAGLAATRWDVVTGPLVRVELAAVDGADLPEHRLVLVAHHLVMDGWSLEVLWADLGRAYERRLRGETFDEPAPVSYGDVAVWAADEAASDRAAADLDHWRARLAGAPASLDLPWLAELPAIRSREDARRERRELDGDLADRLAATARAEQVTPAVLALAAYAVVLARWSGQDDLVIGTPLAGRRHPALDDVVGFFNSTVALRAELAGATTARDVLRRVGDELITAQSHDAAPYDEVVAALRRRDGVFDAWFNVLNYADRPLSLAGVVTRQVPAPLPGALFDIGLYVLPNGAEPAIELVHDARRVGPDTAAAIADEVLAVLRDVVADPGAAVATLGGGARLPAVPPVPAARSLVEVVDGHATARPDAIAVDAPDGVLTYRELVDASVALAATLAGAGAGPGRVVAVTGTPSRDVVTAVLAVRRAGATLSLLDPAHPEQWRAAQAALVAPVARVDGTTVTPLPPPTPHHEPAPGELGGGGVPAGAAYVMFTSGSTATPRAVAGAEPPIAAFLRRHAERHDLGPGDVGCLLSGWGHDPVLRDVWTPLWNGGRLAIPAAATRTDPAALLAWLADRGVTVLHVTPLMADLIAGAAPTAPTTPGATPTATATPAVAPTAALPALRLVCFGGDVLGGPTARAWRRLAPGARLVNVYGSTETPQVGTWLDVPADLDGPCPVGGDGPSGRLVVLRRDGGVARPGHVGDVALRTALPSLGYVGDERATADRLTDAGDGTVLVRTGDVGRVLDDGSVRVLGRCDGELKVRGYRMHPGQIEALLTGVDGVRAAAVTQIPGPAGPRLAAAVVGDGVTAEAARHAVRVGAPAAFTPEVVVVLDRLPLTPNGKVDRRRVAGLAAAHAPMAAATAVTGAAGTTVGDPGAASGPAAIVRAVWREVLGAAEFADDANFFDLGGTSLTLLDAHARLVAALGEPGARLPVVTLFEHPTIRDLTEHVTALITASSGPDGDGATAAGAGVPAAAAPEPVPVPARARVRDAAAERARRRAAHGLTR